MRLARQPVLLLIVVLGLLSLFVSLGLSYMIYRASAGMLDRDLELNLKKAAQKSEAAFKGQSQAEDPEKWMQQQLQFIRGEFGLIDLFVFDENRRSLGDPNEKVGMFTPYLLSRFPRNVLRQLPENKPIMHREKEDPTDTFNHTAAYCLPIGIGEDGKAAAWVFAQANVRNKDAIKEGIADLDRKWKIAAGLATLLTLIMIASIIGIVQRSGKLERKINERARVDMISLLSSALMHEIKTPLATIDGSGQLLQKHFAEKQDADHGELADYIVSESERIKEIVNTSLSIGEIVPVKLSVFVTKVIRSLYPSIKRKQVTVENEIPDEVCVLASSLPLRLVFTNLITNAVQAVSDDDGHIAIRTIRRGDKIGIQVTDNGKGIAKSKFKDLYQLFSSDKKGGTGVGLAASMQAVEEMNGKIEVASTVGVGTTFTVWLPVAENPVSPDTGPAIAVSRP